MKMNDNSLYAVIFATLAAVILSIAFAIPNYWIDHNAKIVQLIESGVDPVAAMCAMQNDYGNHPTCVILATKSK